MLRQRCMRAGRFGVCDLQLGHPGQCLARLARLQRCTACGDTERSRSIHSGVCWACIGPPPAEDDTLGRVFSTAYDDEFPRDDEPERLEVPWN